MNPQDMNIDQLAEALGVTARLERVRKVMDDLFQHIESLSTESGDAADELAYRIGRAANSIDAGGWR